jgi:hypothetical protein
VRIPYASAATMYFVSPDVVCVYASSWPTAMAAVWVTCAFSSSNVAKRQLQHVVERVEHDFGVRMQTFGSDPRVADPDPTGDFVAADAIFRWNALTGARQKVL